MDGIVIVAGALHFSSGVPAARIKGLQDRFLTTHWFMKGERFAEEFFVSWHQILWSVAHGFLD